MKDEIVSCADFITRVYNNIEKSTLQETNKLYSSYEKILLSIKPSSNKQTGENLFAHTKIVDLKNGILLIEADHSGWISLLQLYKNYILGGFKKFLPELKIDSLAFRLSSGKKEMSEEDKIDLYKKETEKINKKMEDAENKMAEYEKKRETQEKKELPEELKEIFRKMQEKVEKKSLTKY